MYTPIRIRINNILYIILTKHYVTIYTMLGVLGPGQEASSTQALPLIKLVYIIY